MPRRRAALALLTLAVLAGAAPAPARPPAQAVEVAGFEFPESAFFDRSSASWFVSNIGGAALDPLARDGNGFLTRLDREGGIVSVRWVEGLNSPKGVRGIDGTLYVADVGEVAVVDVASASIVRRIPLPGSVLLNDVAVEAGSGDVYVSDTLTDTIYRIAGGTQAEVFLQSSALEAPNGLLVDRGRLLVTTIGPGLDPATFGTRAPGRLLEVDLRTREVRPVSGRIGGLDGLERFRDHYLVTDFPGGRVLAVERDGSSAVAETLSPGTADLGVDRSRRVAAIPRLLLGSVLLLPIR